MMTTTTPDAPPPDYTREEFIAKMNDPQWRLEHLYVIVTKGDDETDLAVRFKPNRMQRRLLGRLWPRNVVLKARQLGVTTLFAILWLDTALFAGGAMRCVMIAHEKDAAEEIFAGKILYAYDNLPDWLRESMPLVKRTASQIVFRHNGASVVVTSSGRSGTAHRLHVSELGKMATKYPGKAKEVITGSLPSVPKNGIATVESTAEGQEGRFYDLVQVAKAAAESDKVLTLRDYRFHFFAWWQASEYEIDPEGVKFSEAELAYFHKVQGVIKRQISDRKRAWYVTTLRNDFAGDAPLMWQEYPSYPDEAFAVSVEGSWYAEQLATARAESRIIERLPVESAPVNTFWDIGRGDMTAIWFHQRVLVENRFIGYYENSGKDLDHYAAELNRRGFVYGRHYLPHEASHRRIGKDADSNQTIEEMLRELMPGATFVVVPRVTNLMAGIQATRRAFRSSYFCETECVQGLKRLANYRKRWDPVLGRWSDEELSDDNAHGADAFRQFGQEADAGNQFRGAPIALTKTGAPAPLAQRKRWGRGRVRSPMGV
jgi:hypothetical protein